jgi:CheY-like chemotaxis protein
LTTIFEPFQQADGSTTRKYGGTGLGLSICKKISELMEGDVWAQSPSPKPSNSQPLNQSPGSIFHFTAWLKKAKKGEVKRTGPVSLAGKKTLIVDDNQRNLEILTYITKSAKMDVVALFQGKQVLPALKAAMETGKPFDLCISDIQMPEMSGYDVARKIREWEKSNAEKLTTYGEKATPTYIIALSSMMERDAKKCEDAGFDGFLSKPVRREKLIQMIQKLLANEPKDRKKSVKKRIATQHSIKEEAKQAVSILLVEDNPVNQKLATLMLKKAGYQIEVADNGKVALEKYTDSPGNFDLIFMDIQMPEMDGLEATGAIRKWEKKQTVQGSKLKAEDKNPATRNLKSDTHIPIVAMTANAMKGDREMCLEAGMDDYITKPIKRDLVFEIIEKWVLA